MMKIDFMPMANQCDVLPRLTIVLPWGPIECGHIYFGWLWWMVAIRFGDMPYENK